MDNSNRQYTRFLKPGISVLLAILSMNSLSGQYCKLVKSSDFFIPLVVMIIQDSVYHQMNDSVAKVSSHTNAAFLLINGSQLSMVTIRDTVNFFLNKDAQLSKTNVYLIVAGTKSFFERQNRFSDLIFADKIFIQTDDPSYRPSSYQMVAYQHMNLEDITREMSKSHLWEADLDDIREKSKHDYSKQRIPFEIGIGLTKIFPSGVGTPYDVPQNVTTYDIQYARSLDEKYKFWGDLCIGLSMPSKGNMGSITSSFEDGKYNVMGYTLLSWSVNLSRFVTNSPNLKPFVAAGITKTNFIIMYMKTDGSNMNVKPEMYSYGSLALTIGFEAYFTEKVSFDFRTSYNFSLNTGASINNFNLSFGINYKLQRKKKYFYEYLRLK